MPIKIEKVKEKMATVDVYYVWREISKVAMRNLNGVENTLIPKVMDQLWGISFYDFCTHNFIGVT